VVVWRPLTGLLPTRFSSISLWMGDFLTSPPLVRNMHCWRPGRRVDVCTRPSLSVIRSGFADGAVLPRMLGMKLQRDTFRSARKCLNRFRPMVEQHRSDDSRLRRRTTGVVTVAPLKHSIDALLPISNVHCRRIILKSERTKQPTGEAFADRLCYPSLGSAGASPSGSVVSLEELFITRDCICGGS
jgi:hypothetical protein